MECFRCYDMKVIDQVVMESIKDLLKECHHVIEEEYGDVLDDMNSLKERINRHIILLEAMPDE